jgi:hypothetical protein
MSMPASTPSSTLALTDGSLDLADFFSTEFQGTAHKAPNAEAQPAFTLRDLGVPRSIEVPLERGMVIPNIPGLCIVSIRSCLNHDSLASSSSLSLRFLALSIIPNRMFFGALLCSAVRTIFSP